MIRLIIYTTLLGLGAYAGAEFKRYDIMSACTAAGGTVDARGFCEGAK